MKKQDIAVLACQMEALGMLSENVEWVVSRVEAMRWNGGIGGGRSLPHGRQAFADLAEKHGLVKKAKGK